jgi:hypothetical protein
MTRALVIIEHAITKTLTYFLRLQLVSINVDIYSAAELSSKTNVRDRTNHRQQGSTAKR